MTGAYARQAGVRCRRPATGPLALLLGAALVGWAGAAAGQFLNREEYPLWRNESYENYARFGYRDVRLQRTGKVLQLDETQRVYDPFGTTLLNGRDLYRAQEFRSLSPFGGSLLYKDTLYQGLFQNLVVAHDMYKGWGTSVIVGGAVDAHLSPLQLSVVRMNGLRWDGDSRRNRFTLLGSRISEPLRVFGLARPFDFATYLFGGHWQTQLGNAVRFNASYVNLHITDTLRRRGSGSFRKGEFPTNLETPTRLYVVISDDTPADGGGARVHAVEFYVNGQRSDVVPEMRKIPDLIATAQTQRSVSSNLSSDDLEHLRQRGAWLPRAIDLQSLVDPSRGLLAAGQAVDATQVLEADVDDVLIYGFAVPDGTRELSFRILVSGDYAIDVGAPIGWSGVVGRTWDDWRNVARAEGQPRGASNLGWVEFDYGFPTGLEIYGVETDLDLFGFTVHGDYMVSTHHLVFPASGGRRGQDAEQAFSLTGRRALGPVDLAVEAFRVPPAYRTSFTYWDESVPRRKDFQLIDDNDDRDPWPDSWEHDDPLSLRFQSDVTLSPDEARENLVPAPLRDVGFGVFPGMDDNGDGILDTNVNDNLLPDHLEPFLMYFVESEDFVYGDDFNNNGIVDVRENDNKEDLPYERDSEGIHAFVEVEAARGLRLRLGGHHIGQVAGGGHNRAVYAAAEYQRTLVSGVEFDLRQRTKRVRDDIADPLYEYVFNPLLRSHYEISLRSDPLSYRNSLASLTFGRLRYTRIESMTAESALRLEHNHQQKADFDDGTSQVTGDDWSLGLVNKVAYAWRLAPTWTVTPMLKVTYRRAYAATLDATLAREWVVAPIVRVDWLLTERTALRTGVQGFPFFQHSLRNAAAEFQDFDAWHWVVALQNRSSYIGYQVSLNAGLRKSYTDFRSSLLPGTAESSEFFLQVRTN